MKTVKAMFDPAVVTLSEGGTKERKVKVDEIQINDLWHVSQLKSRPLSKIERVRIIEVWHLAHDLRKHAQRQNEEIVKLHAEVDAFVERDAGASY